MDHWGDPWADNANDKSPTKNAVTSQLPPAFTFAPVPLGGFVDDAGWGNNEDDGYGAWTTSDAGNAASIDVASTPTRDVHAGSADWGTTRAEEENLGPEWPESATDAPQTLEPVDSEPSDSSTVSQLDESASQGVVKEHVQPPTDLESSVRSSTSPSETSRNDLPIESPRTSVEDERALHKDVPPYEPLACAAEAHMIIADYGPDLSPVSAAGSMAQEGEKEVNDSKALEDLDNHAVGAAATDNAHSAVSGDFSASRTAGDLESTPDGSAAALTAESHTLADTFVCENALLAELFPLGEQPEKQLDEHNDPIFTTSARKAWYRVTRKQTMREFNHGDNDDNYIRVTWTNSHVRAEVHKVVSRWAREDRISGTGPGARASFYWDTPAPAVPETPFGHSRAQSFVPATKTALPARQSLPPLASNQPMAFNWSSSAPTDPWKLETPTQRSISAPIAPRNPVVAKLQRQEGRTVSMDLTPRKSEQATHKRTATLSHTFPETKTVATLISPILQPSAEALDAPADLNKLDGASFPTVETTDIPFDDDDDWGEMVQTPTLPTPQQLDPFSQPLASHTISPSPLLSSSESPVTTGGEAGPVGPLFAAPIVRLQSIISPTSALFKGNAFVPLNAEHGPIGPGILKPANRSVLPVPERNVEDTVPGEAVAESSGFTSISPRVEASREGNEAFSPSLNALGPVGQVVKKASLTPAALPARPEQAPVDAWADADFSFFESSLPTSALQPTHAHDPPDPFSFFDTPALASIPPSSMSSTRSPPRNPTPLLQPLSGATSSVQQRKVEEDQIINDILRGLPDLSYMLRQ